MRILNIVMLLAFLLSVFVQINDPDPLLWIIVYGLAAAACIMYHVKKLEWRYPAVLGVLTLLWAASLAPAVIGKVGWGELVTDITMKTIAVEKGREMGGLLIIAAWMLVLAQNLRNSKQE